MAGQSNKKALLVIIWLITLLVIIGVSYFFAQKNSSPKFSTKIDNLIFNSENQPPKYVITLPDEENQAQKTNYKQAIEAIKSDEVKIQDAIDVAKTMPKIESLKQIQNARSLQEEVVNDGIKPWIAYRRNTTTPQNYYKVAVIIKKSGLSEKETMNIVKTIHEDTCLSFSPYTKDLDKDIDFARRYGNETYLDVSIKSKDFLNRDTGPKSLDLSKDFSEVVQNFTKDFLTPPLAIGGFTIYGNVSIEETDKMKKFLNFIEDKGFLVIDATSNQTLDSIETNGLPRVKADIMIDTAVPKYKLNEYFEEAENIAKKQGYVVIVIDPKPLNIVSLMDWFETFSKVYSYDEIKDGAVANRPFVVVPVSSLVVE